VLLALVVVTGVVATVVGGRLANFSAIQLGTETTVVGKLVADPKRRKALRRGLWADFGFLLVYWLAFVAAAILLAHRGHYWGRWVGAVVVLAASATALLDVVENVRTLGVLARNRAGDVLPLMQLRELRHASLAKWAASATTVGLLSTLFFQHSWIAWLGIALVALAAIGFVGLLWNPLIRVYMLGVAVVCGVAAVVFLFSPGTLIGGL
jgi:hypothetical protein